MAKKGTTQMGVQTSSPLRIKKDAPNVNNYVTEEALEEVVSDDVFEAADQPD